MPTLLGRSDIVADPKGCKCWNHVSIQKIQPTTDRYRISLFSRQFIWEFMQISKRLSRMPQHWNCMAQDVYRNFDNQYKSRKLISQSFAIISARHAISSSVPLLTHAKTRFCCLRSIWMKSFSCGSWLEMASPRCSEASSKHSCLRSSWINSRTVLDSVPENLWKELTLYKTLHYITLHYITLQRTVLVTLDMSAAFDCVDHGNLLRRLQICYGISEVVLLNKVILWLQNTVCMDSKSNFRNKRSKTN